MSVSGKEKSSSQAMEVDEDPEVTSKEILVYMEFGDKMKDYLFDNKIFFRMARFEGNPLIQLNGHIFKGEYRSCVGTNIFFSDSTSKEPESVLESGRSIRLKHEATQFKMLDLKPVKIPSDMADLPQPPHDIKINKNYDYKSLLRKFAHGTLSLKEDLVVVPREQVTNEVNTSDSIQTTVENKKVGEVDNNSVKTVSNIEKLLECASKSQPKLGSSTEKQSNTNSTQGEKTEVIVDILTHKYEKLKRLAMRPTRRKREPQAVVECEEKYQQAYAYNSLKCMVMKPSDYFRTISENFNEKTLEGAVDVDRSIRQGVINYSPEYYRVLTEEEKSALMSIKNFDNLSMAARYIVIKSHLDHLESTLPGLCREELFEKDANGRTFQENIKIYKRLLRVLSGLVKEKYCYDSDVEEDT